MNVISLSQMFLIKIIFFNQSFNIYLFFYQVLSWVLFVIKNKCIRINATFSNFQIPGMNSYLLSGVQKRYLNGANHGKMQIVIN